MRKILLVAMFTLSWLISGAADAAPQVRLETNYGVITIMLNSDKAPITVDNFLQYVRSGHYDGTIFHRVIPNFMIQGGGFNQQMNQKRARPAIKNEADNGLKNVIGTIAMARTSDPHSAGAQFFINTKDNRSLNHTGKTRRGWGYTVFGKVSKGMDVVRKIEAQPTTTKSGHRDVPKMPIIIKTATIITE